MQPPLLVVDAPSLLFRGFFALPKSITDDQGHPVNGLLGMANLVLQAHERFAPRATVLCWGAEAAHYRTAAFPAYHADRPPVPDALERQFALAPGFFDAFGFTSLSTEDLEADDLLGTLAVLETHAGGRTVLFTGDRDMFQCVDDDVVVLFPEKGGPTVVDADGVRDRYGIDPEQVPDFIALRGDPSDGLPGAKGIGAKTAAELLRAHGSLEALLALPAGLTPRQRGALTDQADELRAFLDIARLRPVPGLERPADRPLDPAA
jgi:5'-3' exonuclease